jgi:hypothetical protein
MKLISPMQRYTSRVTPKDADGNAISTDDGEEDTAVNPKTEPCGGQKSGRVHFDAESGSKAFIAWKTLHPDETGNCTIRLGNGNIASNLQVLKPLDGSGKKTKGTFPCGRSESFEEGKEIKFPGNMSCDHCTL